MEVDRTPRAPTVVLSLRLPDSSMEALTEWARSQGKAAGTLARELIEAAIASGGPVTPPRLAGMFSRWVNEALEPTSTVDFIFASSPIAATCWFSYESRQLLEENYHFALTGTRLFQDPVLTSRTIEAETEPAGENAA